MQREIAQYARPLVLYFVKSQNLYLLLLANDVSFTCYLLVIGRFNAFFCNSQSSLKVNNHLFHGYGVIITNCYSRPTYIYCEIIALCIKQALAEIISICIV